MTIRQLLFDYSLNADRRLAAHRIGSALARRVLRRCGTRTVAYSVDGVTIDFPATHLTPHVWAREPNNSKSLGRVARAVADKYATSVMVDVGANVGDSAAIIRSAGVGNRVLAIEGVEQFFGVLAANAAALGNVDAINCFVGTPAQSGNVSLKILDTGNAVVRSGNVGDDAEWSAGSAEFRTLRSIVSDRAPGASIKLIKTDIEGFDLPVLAGSMDLIAEQLPVIFLELHVSDADEAATAVGWQSVFDDLLALGYERAFYWHNSGDLMALVRLDDSDGLRALNGFYRNRNGLMYADVCIVHASDADISTLLLEGEIDLGRAMRHAAS